MALKELSNPPNPWHTSHVEWLGAPPPARLHVYEERARSIVSENQSPDLGFRFSLNPYRGCYHACSYCYARPSHQYWDLGAGTDWERKLVAKVNAPEVLRRTFMRPSWMGDEIVFSGNTDCYQPLEASYRLTRQCLELCAEFRNPVTVITKSALVRRDIDLLQSLATDARATVHVSIPFIDKDTCRAIEPAAPSPRVRFDAVEALSRAGIPVGIAIAPVIPGLSDDQIPAILEEAAARGAQRAWCVLLRLPSQVEPVFVDRLRASHPLRAERVLSAIKDMRQGKLNQAGFHRRMRGVGPRWLAIKSLFEVTCRRLGLTTGEHRPKEPTPFQRPGQQFTLGLD